MCSKLDRGTRHYVLAVGSFFDSPSSVSFNVFFNFHTYKVPYLLLGVSFMIWFTSDNHFGHANIIRYSERPFQDVPEMNEIMIKNWNERVAPTDTVYHLGDFSMNFENMRSVTPRLQGTIHLIAGNHDHCHSVHRKPQNRKKYYDAGFKTINEELIIEFPVLGKVRLHHMPYFNTEEPKLKYADIRPKEDGMILLHGHVHKAFKYNATKKMLNVGVDVWDYAPVSLDTVVNFIQTTF